MQQIGGKALQCNAASQRAAVVVFPSCLATALFPLMYFRGTTRQSMDRAPKEGGADDAISDATSK